MPSSPKAPITAANFLTYVDSGLYHAARFYRIVGPDLDSKGRKLSIVQGGLGPQFENDPPRPPIAHEPTQQTGLHHKDGTLSMARWAPGSAASEFFVVVGDTPALDFGGTLNPDGQGFAAFGHVASGMAIVRRMNAMSAGTASPSPFMQGQSLVPTVPWTIRRL